MAELNAFITMAPEPAPGATARGPLAGVRLAVKDNIDTADLPTSGGTPALRGARPRRDAPAVARLRGAGAVVVGKTNLHELAFGTTSRNAEFGTVANPVADGRSAGGSSGGSAAAVAAGLVPIALGTDTGGSVRVPASYCGIVGFRPSTGRWGRGGTVPLAPTRDTIGVLARTVAEVALVDSVVTGDASADPVGLAGLRLGVPREGYYADLDPAVAAVAAAALDRLADAGAELVEVRVVAAHELDTRCGFPIVRYELEHALPGYLTTLPPPHRALTAAQVFASVRSPDVRAAVDRILDAPEPEANYRACLAMREDLRDAYARTFRRDRVAALVYPTVPFGPPPVEDHRWTVHNGRDVDLFKTSVRNTSPGSVAGMPAISLPVGNDSGRPIGMSLEGPAGADRDLLAIADAVERACLPLVFPQGKP